MIFLKRVFNNSILKTLYISIVVIWLIANMMIVYKNFDVRKKQSESSIQKNIKIERLISKKQSLTLIHQNKITASPLTWCFNEYLSSPNLLPEINELASNRSPIFFIETSCNSRSSGIVVLNARQACAIESAAKMNPESDIYVLFVGQTSLDNITDDKITNRLLNELLSYNNIHFRYLNIPNFTKDTILEDFYWAGTLSPIYIYTHTSDMLRLLTLWKYGGTYLDLDMIVMASLKELGVNYAGAEDGEQVGNSILNFENTGIGQKFLEDALYDFRDHFNPNEWVTNGGGVITRMFQKYCETKETVEMTRKKCLNLHIYPPETFYPISWTEWERLFDANEKDIEKSIKNSKTLHLWNKLSSKGEIRVGSKEPFSLVAKDFCPKIYERCKLK